MNIYKISFGPIDYHRYIFNCLDKNGINNWSSLNKVNIPYISKLNELFELFLKKNDDELSFEFDFRGETIVFYLRKEKIY